mgnify:CR=1 FL=1
MKSRIILASASPRRQELLTQIGLPFEVCPSEWEEVTDKELPEEVVQELSYHKAMEVYERNVTEEGTVVIGADTIVACGGQVLGKPGNRERAEEMLGKLQGGTHQVYTGVAFVWKEKGRTETAGFYECTDVESLWTRPALTGYRAVSPLLYRGYAGITITWWACRWAGSTRN